jgi:hypothetical protein
MLHVMRFSGGLQVCIHVGVYVGTRADAPLRGAQLDFWDSASWNFLQNFCVTHFCGKLIYRLGYMLVYMLIVLSFVDII